MVKIVSLTDLSSLENLGAHDQLPKFDLAQCHAHRCDAHAVNLRHGSVVARCSLWWSETPPIQGERPGVIGHYAALDLPAGKELLDAAGNELAAHRCTRAIGPMDGNTWRRYRLVTERGPEPPFLLEPENPNDWPEHWRTAGFSALATYFSALNEDLSYEDAKVMRAGERLRKNGIQLRPLNPERFDEELRVIYDVSARSFIENFLYTPIGEAEFLAQYAAVRTRIRPELVLIAEQHGDPLGYVFTIPDWLQAVRGATVDTVIVKTVAVLPERRCAGLGAWLVAQTQIAARALGYKRAIHALMHESNYSLNLSARYAKAFRRYTFFSKPLE